MKVEDIKTHPITSNPADADSDNDGIPDLYDANKLKAGGDEDIINNYKNAFVVFNLEKENKLKLTGDKVLVKSLPDDSSTTLKTINFNKIKNSFNVIPNAVALTSKKSWVKIMYDGVYGYVEGELVEVNSSNESLLRLMFSSESPINGISYSAYWHSNSNITISGSVKYTDALSEVKPTALSQSQLGFLYKMAEDIGNKIELDDMFEWMLAISMHESAMGTAIETWEYPAYGYFQCVASDNEPSLANNIVDLNTRKNDYILNKWVENANRLDSIMVL